MATLDGSFPSATQLAVSTGTAPLAPPTVSVGDLLNASQSPSQGGGGLKADSNDANYTTRTSTNGKRSRKPTATTSPTVDSAAEREILINQVLDLQENVKGLIDRVESAREGHGKLSAENAVLLKYINNLMSAGGGK